MKRYPITATILSDHTSKMKMQKKSEITTQMLIWFILVIGFIVVSIIILTNIKTIMGWLLSLVPFLR